MEQTTTHSMSANAQRRMKSYLKNRDKELKKKRERYQAAKNQPQKETAEAREKRLERQRKYNQAISTGEIETYDFLNTGTKRNCEGTLLLLLGKKAQNDPGNQLKVMQRNIWLLEMHRIKMRNPDDIKRCNNTITHLQAQIVALQNPLSVVDI